MLLQESATNPRASDRALASIREQIVTLELPPGSPLSDRELSEQLGVSRTPVREALLKLADIGLVEIRPQVGTFVSRIRIEEALDANFIRRELESGIAREAARRISPEQVEVLEFLLGQQGLDQAQKNRKLFDQLDVQFHARIHDIAGNAMAWNIVRDARTIVDRIRNLSLTYDPEYEEILADHRRIVDAITRRAGAAAERAMNDHIDRVNRITEELASRYPTYFEAGDD